jgi:hypothetical protein
LTGQQLTFLFIQGTGYTEAYNATVLQSTNATCVKPENYNIITVDSTSTAGFVGNIDTSAHKNGGVIGGAVGGILGALALVAIFLIWRHRKNRKRTFTGDVTGDNASEDAVLTPTESIKLEVPGSQRPNRYSASPRPKPQ